MQIFFEAIGKSLVYANSYNYVHLLKYTTVLFKGYVTCDILPYMVLYQYII